MTHAEKLIAESRHHVETTYMMANLQQYANIAVRKLLNKEHEVYKQTLRTISANTHDADELSRKADNASKLAIENINKIIISVA